MDKLVASANAYFDLVEGVPFGRVLRSGVVWLFLTLALCFSVSFFCFISSKLGQADPDVFDWSFVLVLTFEVATLWSLAKVKSRMNRLRHGQLSDRCGHVFLNLRQAKRHALRRFFGKDESQYLAFAKEIAEAMQLQETLRTGKELDAARLLRLLYDPDSKPRIYALLLVIVSGLTALAIRSGAGIDAVFDLIPQSMPELMLGIAQLAMVLTPILLGIHVMWVIVAWLCHSLVLKLERRTGGELALRLVQQDLLRNHQFFTPIRMKLVDGRLFDPAAVAPDHPEAS